MISAIHSTFPKGQDRQGFRRTLDLFEKAFSNKGSYFELERIREDIRTEIISKMWESGLGIVSDGMLNWSDDLNPMVSGSGVRAGSPPRVSSLFFNKGYIFEDEVGMIKRNPLPWANGKFCLTGPYSLTKQCYLDVEGVSEFEWIDHFAKLVAAQISVLSKEFKYIQINEPALAGTDDFALFDQGLHKLKEYESLEGISQNCSIILSAPGADLSQDVLWTLVSSCAWNGEIIHLDLVNGWRSVDRLQWICKERNHTIRFQLGVLSGESLYAGVHKDAVDKVRETLSILPNAKCELITTSCGVGNLPWEVAVERIRQTKSVADECGQLIKVNGGTLL